MGRCPARLVASVSVVFGLVSSGAVRAQLAPRQPERGAAVLNYDIRVLGASELARVLRDAGFASREPEAARRRAGFLAALERARAGTPGLEARLETGLGSIELLSASGRGLSTPDQRAGAAIAVDFLRERADLYGLRPDEIAALAVLGESTAGRGLRMVRLEQRVGGLPVFQGELRVLLDRQGRVVRTVGRLVPGLEPRAGSDPGLGAAAALEAALANVGIEAPAAAMRASGSGERWQIDAATAAVLGPVSSWRVLFPLATAAAVPAWAQVVFTGGAADWYSVVSALDGTVLYRKNLRHHASTEEARFSVYVQGDGKTPADNPAPHSPTTVSSGSGTQFAEIARTIVAMSGVQDLAASPDGWIPDGATTTTGNNTDTYLDADGNNVPDPAQLDAAGRPTGNPDATPAIGTSSALRCANSTTPPPPPAPTPTPATTRSTLTSGAAR